jgi:hypothetical protein
MITRDEALAITRNGQTTTILKAIAQIDRHITESAKEGYDGVVEDLRIRKLSKNERKTIKLYYEILGYKNIKVGKKSIDISWG